MNRTVAAVTFSVLVLALAPLPSQQIGSSASLQSSVPEIQGLPAEARAAADSIDPEKIRAHVRFLSLDLLEGRGPARAAVIWRRSTLRRNLHSTGLSRPVTMEPTFSMCRFTRCTRLKTRRRRVLN